MTCSTGNGFATAAFNFLHRVEGALPAALCLICPGAGQCTLSEQQWGGVGAVGDDWHLAEDRNWDMLLCRLNG